VPRWVSVKVDAVIPATWRRLNRPDPGLDHERLREGIRRFAAAFEGTLVSETMLVEGVNDDPESVAAVGRFLAEVGVTLAYLAIPTRPTPYPGIGAPGEATVNRAFHVLAGYVPRVEYLVGYEGDAFASTGDPRADLLALTAVHPMRASAVAGLLEWTGTPWGIVEELVASGALSEVEYGGTRYYLRRWRR
jgi:wyosine [tRNA(Phe)-imidazoG37] synthetase (radical SAM superfamily)